MPLTHPPEWVRIAQDGRGLNGGFWTTAAATEESPKFIREDLAITTNAETIDKAAKYLRETYRKGQILKDWSALPKSAKKKWIVLATGLFEAVRT